MKKLTMILTLMLVAASSYAGTDGKAPERYSDRWDETRGEPAPHSENPDRYASLFLGVKIGRLNGSGVTNENFAHLSGTDLNNVPAAINTKDEMSLTTFSPSVRFPMTNRLTVEISWDRVIQSYEFSGYPARFKETLRGDVFGVGARFYFPD